MRRDLGAHDFGPAGDELARGKALLGEGVLERLVQKVRERPRIGFAGLVHARTLCHIGRHDASSWEEAAKARLAAGGPAGRRPARLVRPPSPLAAVARAARRAARSLPGLALRGHAATDHREGGRALFRALPRALADGAGAGGGAAR